MIRKAKRSNQVQNVKPLMKKLLINDISIYI